MRRRGVRWLDAARDAAHAVAWRVRARLTRGRREAELDEEIRAHVERLADEHRSRGLGESEAREAALRDFGGVEPMRETCRDMRRLPVVDGVAVDLRFAWRSLRRQPAFCATAVVTFALGIGASAALYSVLREAVLLPLPVPNASGLVWVVNSWRGALGGMMNVEYLAWQAQSRSFEKTAAYATRQMTLTGGRPAERVLVGTVTASFFSALGVAPAVGRDFLPEEDRTGRERVALLSDAAWSARYSADPSVVGRNVVLDGRAYFVAGVLPRGYRFLDREQPSVYVPYVLPSTRPGGPLSVEQVQVVGWLRKGVSAAAAQAELATILERSRSVYPLSALSYAFGERPQVRVVTNGEWRRAHVGAAPFVLAGAVGLLLLIACANVANLQLARFLDRRQELAVRAALGAGRARLVRQLVTESLLLAALGGLAALALAHLAVRLAAALSPESLDYLRDVRVDPTTVLFAAALVLVTGIASSLLPAVIGTTRHAALQVGTPRHTQGPAARRWAAAFSGVTLALSVVLLVASGLMARSFVRLTRLGYGLEPKNLLTLRLGLPVSRYGTREALGTAGQRLASELAVLPGVRSVGLSDVGPLGWCHAYSLQLEGARSDGQRPNVCEEAVSAGYLQTLGVRLLRGRLFREVEDAGAASVAVIDESAARVFFGSRDPIGARLRTRDEWLTVVGVVANLRSSRSDPGRPTLFQPLRQPDSALMNAARMAESSRGLPGSDMFPSATELTAVVRTAPAIDPSSLAAAARTRVAQLDRDLVVYDVATMDERLAATVAVDRFLMALLVALSAVALTLALVGVYGVTSYGVSRRTAEIGVRMALGATPARARGLVLGQAARVAALAVCLGLLGVLAAGRYLRSLLFETGTADPATLAGVAALVFAVAVIAAALPAQRAATIDPAVALRCD